MATTRDGTPGDPLDSALEARGARVVSWPTLAFGGPEDPEPLERAMASLHDYEWIVFTSARAVEAVADGLRRWAGGARPGHALSGGGPSTAHGGSAASVRGSPRIAVVGPATARAVRNAEKVATAGFTRTAETVATSEFGRTVGWGCPFVGPGPGAEGLARALTAAHDLDGARVLFPTTPMAASTLEDALRGAGARVDRVVAYRTVPSPPDPERIRADLQAGVDAVAFASPSAVDAVADAVGRPLRAAFSETAAAAIGPTTAAALDGAGFPGAAVAAEPSLDGLAEACVLLFRTNPSAP